MGKENIFLRGRRKTEKEQNIWKKKIYFYLQRIRKMEKEKEENIWRKKIFFCVEEKEQENQIKNKNNRNIFFVTGTTLIISSNMGF